MKKPKVIVQVGDSHFWKQSRWDECLRLHDEIAADVERRRPDLVIHTGDVYQQAPTEEEQNAFARWGTRITNVCPLFIVRGNHDPLGWLAIMQLLETKYPIIVEERCGVHVIAGIAVAAVAWPRKAELAASLAATATQEEIGQLAAQALRNVLSGLGDELAKHDGPRVLAAHAMVTGSKTSAGQPLVGLDMTIGVEDLALARADYVALGHIHQAQDWSHGTMPIVYTGSPRRTAYGEVEDKGFVVASFEHFDGEVTDPNARRWGLAGWDRIILPATRMFDVHETFGESTPGGGYTWLEGLEGAPASNADIRGAELRFRYDVPSDQRVIAELAAKEVEAHFYGLGAADVKVEPEVIPVTRARAPEVAAAETVEEQLVAFWKARGLEIAPERQARLRAKLAEVVGPEAQGAKRRGALRYTRIRHRGFATTQPVDIDFETTQGPLLALVGPNGVGKSTTLELLYAALFGDMPTRGSLGTLATARDAQLEVGVVGSDGVPYTIRHDVDGQTRKGTVLVTDAHGRAVLPDTQVSKFYPWVEKRTPPAAVVSASMFAAQGSRGLLGMKEGDLKAVILRAIGCEPLEGWSKTSRENARTAKGKMEVAAGRLGDERARAVPLATAELRLAAAEEAVARAKQGLEAETARVEKARAAEAAHREGARLLAEAQDRVRVATAAYDASLAKVRGLEARMVQDGALLGEGEAIRSAAADLAGLAERESALLANVAKAKADWEAAGIEQRHAAQALADARKRWADLYEKVKKGEERLREKPAVEEASARAATLRVEVAAAEKAAEDAMAEVTRLGGVALVGAEGRISGLRGGLQKIVEDRCYASDDARDALKQDDEALAQAIAIPVQLSNAKNAGMKLAAERRRLVEDLARAQQRAGEFPALLALETDLLQLRAELAVAFDEGTLAKAADANASALQEERRGLVTRLEASLPPMAAERARLSPLARRAVDLAAATARVEALEPELRAARTDVEAKGNELAAIALPNVAAYDARILEDALKDQRLAIDHERIAETGLVQARSVVETAVASEARQAELEAERALHEDGVADWTHLADALGRDGIQALLIDAAGPKLTTLANDLLHACHGPRFTVRIDANPFTADGKRQTEGCEIQVTDTKPREDGTVGGEREGSTFSGGERGILNEALGLALTMLVCQRSGLREPTLVRDETGAALDPENGRAYIAMLRMAAQQVNAHRIVFVTHDPALAALADGRIDLGVPRVANKAAASRTVLDADADAPKKRRTRKAAA